MRKICYNTVFLWPLFSRKSTVCPYKVKYGSEKNLCSGIITCHTLFSATCLHKTTIRAVFDFVIVQVKTVLKGSNLIRYYGPIVWSLATEEIRYADSLEKFKIEIRRRKPINCPCRICKNYILNVGFLATSVTKDKKNITWI